VYDADYLTNIHTQANALESIEMILCINDAE
jgi:hypothetical protein